MLLFYLLAAPTDPLEVAVRVLPLSSTARERTIAAFSGALRGVFLSSIKLARVQWGPRPDAERTPKPGPQQLLACHSTCTVGSGYLRALVVGNACVTRDRRRRACRDLALSRCVVDGPQAMFHAVFTWLTFRMFGVLLVYVSTLASAVGAVMPLVPVWLIAVPAAAQLALQVRPRRAHRDSGTPHCYLNVSFGALDGCQL